MASAYPLAAIVKNPKKYADTVDDDELVELLTSLSDAYYNTDKAIVPDTTYDALIDILRERDPKNEFLKHVGAPVKGTKNKVKLPYPMGSLTKIKLDDKDKKDGIITWTTKYEGPYFISDKLDGASVQIYKDANGTLSMYSRGDGTTGQDISHLIKYAISKTTMTAIPNNTSIRGEFIISKENFKKIQDRMCNARNAVAGLINSKTVDTDIAKITDFVTYTILYPRLSYDEQVKRLEKYGCKVVNYTFLKKISTPILKAHLENRRAKSAYEIDGIVCIDNSQIYQHNGGYQDHEFAFKMITDDQIAETTVLEVIWSASMDGYLVPKIRIDPVNLVGTTITYAAAHNAKYIVDNNIGPGAKIKIIRSGDVIPYILDIIKGAKGGPQMPTCDYEWNETKVNLVIKDDGTGIDNTTVTIKLLIHFFTTIGVKFMGKGVITKLAEHGYDSVAKILLAEKGDLTDIEGLGHKTVDRIYSEIDRAFDEMKLETFMDASHKLGRNLGERKLKDIVATYPLILKEPMKGLRDKIMDINGFSDKLADQFVENLPAFKKFFNEINKIRDLSRFLEVKEKKKEKKNAVVKKRVRDSDDDSENDSDSSDSDDSDNNDDDADDNIFEGKTIVFTGFRDKSLETFIENNGGKVSSSVSKNTYILVHKDDADTNTNKFTKASSLGVTLMKLSEFKEEYT